MFAGTRVKGEDFGRRNANECDGGDSGGLKASCQQVVGGVTRAREQVFGEFGVVSQ